LSIEEKAFFAATYKVLCDQEFRCFLCKQKYSIEQRNGSKACEKPTKKVVFRDARGIQFNKCVGNFYVESYSHWFDIFRHYSKGVSIFKGAMEEWPNKNVEAIQFIELLEYERQRRELEK